MSSPATHYMDTAEAYLDFENADFSWMGATIIDDDDLMFSGKPLCAWYEEDRQRFSNPYDEEEHRGRERVRREYSSDSSSSQQRSTHVSSSSSTTPSSSSSALCESNEEKQH
ncbi:hypothetical protein CFO_g2539 [Ceratocystis platani]|uniref:Uncharacterized protein n=1 Tax=Ceratocystis fimbriata f. sp. platani TaxID=88771 RepID=A0A0F8B1K7_CERFI|nr:hypothetical protein CFO_g2539 [Ceratocystis platani]